LALAILILVPLLAAIPGGAPRAGAQDDVSVTMVTDTAGLGDQNFNDAVRAGLAQAETDFGVAVNVLESQEVADYVPNLEAGAEDSDLTVATGFLLIDAVTDVSARFPDSDFVLIDGTPSEERENVLGVLFREHEGAFLAGVVAARTTQTGKVGILGGQDIPPVERYEVGFVAGVESVNPDVEVVITYTDTFGDPALGKEQSLALYNQDVDIVFAIAGATGIGAFEAAQEKGEGFWVIAADQDQSQLGAEFQLCVATKSLTAAVYEAVKSVTEGGFEGGVLDVGLAEGGSELTTPGDFVPEEVLAEVDRYRQAIIAGEFEVPATRDELEGFTAPTLGSPAAGTPEA
jgi:basic membrane protein A